MSSRKRQWSKPQLVVLGRGKPEENVLAACKHGNGPGPGNTGACNKINLCSNQADS